jgi:hypothetical protein
MAYYTGFERPHFPTAGLWLEDYRAAKAEGRRPWEPTTREELILADDEKLLLLNPQWLPGRQGLRLLGLPDAFGRQPRPWTERSQERFLATLHQDPEFLAAVRVLIGGQRA